MVGAQSENDLEAARPYLQLMGRNIVHCGQLGTGQVAKICNNMLLGISMLATSETMNLGMRLGIYHHLLLLLLRYTLYNILYILIVI
jgi:3-hydroxyisobutyrate dehydrogenase